MTTGDPTIARTSGSVRSEHAACGAALAELEWVAEHGSGDKDRDDPRFLLHGESVYAVPSEARPNWPGCCGG